MIKHIIASYLVLLLTTIISCLLLILVSILISSNRVIGIGYGISGGIVVGYILVCIVFKKSLKVIITQTLIYCSIVLIMMFLVSNYMASMQNILLFFVMFFGYLLSEYLGTFFNRLYRR